MAETNEDIDSQKLNSVNSKLIDSKLDKKVEEESKAPITLSRKMRWIVYFILLYISIVMELDQGVLSSTTDSLSKDMELNDSQLGGLGSMVFLGKSIGCLIFFTLINKLNRKYMLLVTSFLTILSLILTTQTKNLALLYICRIVVGIAQSYLGIYSPVWADQFGIHKYKSIILSLQHLSSSLGYLFGYVMGIWLGWVLAFYVQNIMLLIPIVILIFISDKFFSMSLMPVKSKLKLLKTENEDNKEKKEEKKDKIEDEIKKIKTTILDDSYEEEKIDNKHNGEFKEKDGDNNNEEESINLDDDISLFEDLQKQGEDMSKGSIKLQIKAIIKSPLFILINITLCSIYAIVAAIQFWINDYLQYGLKIEEAQTRFIMFGSVIVTSPPLGMIIGGIILSKVGGYEAEKAIYIPLIASLIVVIFANLAPLSTNVYIFLPLFWVYFFSGSAVIPAANGISLVSVDKKFAGAASSISILVYNVLGRFPGPNLYAFFKSWVDDPSSRTPMWLLLNVSVIGFLAVLFSLKFNKQKFIKLREELLKKESKEEEKEDNINNDNNEHNYNNEEVETLIIDNKDEDEINNNINEKGVNKEANVVENNDNNNEQKNENEEIKIEGNDEQKGENN
jgi:MFS family permease